MRSEKTENIVDLAASLAAKADELDQVLIIYRRKQTGDDEDTHGSMDCCQRRTRRGWYERERV